MTQSASTPALKMGLPISNAKLGMWLFLGTEIMFFTAFIGSYIVFRVGARDLWPTDPAVTHIRIWAGAVNTFVLLTSSYFVVVAHESMGKKNFAKARKYLVFTLLCACLFLGIKGVEYAGKISHDILPGRIPESDRQAVAKLIGDLDGVKLSTLHSLSAAEGNDDEKIAALRNELSQLNASNDESPRKAELTAFDDLNTQISRLKEQFRAETLTLPGAEEHLQMMKDESGLGDLVSHLHVSHPIVYGNLFASTYFLMTGFHAIHVLVGMLLFVIVLMQREKLNETWSDFVENSGLYWHFVDLVWIFLFPLIYIV